MNNNKLEFIRYLTYLQNQAWFQNLSMQEYDELIAKLKIKFNL